MKRSEEVKKSGDSNPVPEPSGRNSATGSRLESRGRANRRLRIWEKCVEIVLRPSARTLSVRQDKFGRFLPALTDRLARFDRSDPVRYDFALCRLGILDLCSRVRRKENCDICLLRDVCRVRVVR